MAPDDYVAVVERDGRLLADAVEAAGAHAVVGACPGWTVMSLVAHVCQVHNFCRRIVEERLDRPLKMEPPPEVEGKELLAWYRAGLDGLVTVLAETDPSTPVWTWTPQKNVAYIQRRLAQEMAVHRWDAEAAAGRVYAIDPALAVDGVDEFLDFVTPFPFKDAEPMGGTLHLHATDTEGEWFVEQSGDALSVGRPAATVDVEVRATAADLLLQLWRRPAVGEVQLIGDQRVLERFVARTNLN